ncbi:cobalamin biosynthesis protein [Gordonia sp. LSe1-13]|uniref:Cobalamin biosynthesis protein CobD n=1 Tax=Gordonia sesuvii TaxID=3116777 RepID=A0ABU7MH40_9ACTN|nr:cobalamin biosynthesis protein [Gordonia sp. LSe1-13]
MGLVADRAVGDPRRLHPVAGLGRAIGLAETWLYHDTRRHGVLLAGLCVGTAWTAAALVGARTRGRTRVLVTAATTWSVLGGTTLCRVGEDVADLLDDGDIDGARALVPSLCGRDPESLDAAGMVRAAVESIAENTSDAAVAPLFWGGVAGLPGLVAYRTVNTLDSMVGYRSPRHERFGWASARLDDLVNLVPARLSGLLVAALGGAPRRSIGAWRRDARAHPSPNAGVVEAAFAGALGVRLGGRTEYPHGVEQRPELGTGPAPTTADLRAAARLSRRVQVGAALVAAGLAVGVSRRSGV